MHVLVVEDDSGAVEILENHLTQWGYRVERAASCSEALEKVGLFDFKLILLDLFLPDGMGHHLISRFREILPGVAIITLTGQNTRELEQEVRREGVLFYMIKPFEARYLKSIVRHIAGEPGLEIGKEMRT